MNLPSSAPGLLVAVGVLAAAGGLVIGGAALPSVAALNRISTPVGESLPVAPATAALICPGPETLRVPDGATAVDPGAPVLISAVVGSASSAASARLRVLGDRSKAAEDAVEDANQRGLPTGMTRGEELRMATDGPGVRVGTLALTRLGPAILSAPLSSAENTGLGGREVDPAPAVAAVQSTLVRSGDLRSLTATSCTSPESDSWLVGGATVPGQRLRLLLANPAGTAAIADVRVYGPRGRVRAAAGDGLVVPAGGQIAVLVDALAPGLERVAMQVTTRTGRVHATAHHSVLRGLDPGGADAVPVAAAPAKTQAVPGVSLVNGYSRTAEDPTAAGSTAIRVAVPGAEEAVVRIRLLDSGGAVELPRAAVVNVPGGGVVDVPISGIPAGTYTAVIDADVPVVAGGLIGRGPVAGTAPAAEIAWASAARPLAAGSYLALPPQARSTLSLVAATDPGTLTVREIRADGSSAAPVSVRVAADTSATVQLSAEAVAVLITEIEGGPMQGAVVTWLSDPRGALISVLAVQPPARTQPPTVALLDRTLGIGQPGQSSRP